MEPLDNVVYCILFFRARFESLIMSLVQQISSLIDGVFTEASITKSNIQKVILYVHCGYKALCQTPFPLKCLLEKTSLCLFWRRIFLATKSISINCMMKIGV